MPELPEVETIRKQLEKALIGKKIKSAEIRLSKLVKGISAREFENKIRGALIKSIKRRAKILIVGLSNPVRWQIGNFSLVIHLKLTGQLIYQEKYDPKQITKYTHIIYYFSDGSTLFHNDLRRFGYVKLIPAEKTDKLLEEKEKFGPEPLEKQFTLEKFKKILSKRQGAKIKPLLMDQTFIAGIGNVYSDEILFYASVRPMRIATSLKPAEIQKIYQGIKKILPEAIRLHGSSVDTYIDIKGKQGKYISRLKVYGRDNKLCLKCKTKIERVKINGRSAHFCPRCQI